MDAKPLAIALTIHLLHLTIILALMTSRCAQAQSSQPRAVLSILRDVDLQVGAHVTGIQPPLPAGSAKDGALTVYRP